ncbi:MAG: metal ABC transporter ATP-binding protein [Firmicutes bacterium]|nr:metal ABC transporter ATP-binding protein [Bacillota bacterium]
MALIGCKDVSFAYEGKTVVEDVDFEINNGDYLCIAGENGSGKSTLIKGLLRLKSPSGGSIEYGEGLKATDIGFLPQLSESSGDFPASVYEVVLSGRLGGLGMRPFYSAKDKAATHKNMEFMGISDLKTRCFRELSGGQKQRVLIARALCATKRILLLDEPVSGLDPLVTSELYSLISHINSEMKITIVMVTHDISSAIKYCGKVLHLGKKQLFFGSSEEYMKSEPGQRFLGGAQDD